MRVYEAAKLLGVSSKEALSLLSKGGFEHATHMAVLSGKEVEYLEQQLKPSVLQEKKEPENLIEQKISSTNSTSQQESMSELSPNAVASNAPQSRSNGPFQQDGDSIRVVSSGRKHERVIASPSEIIIDKEKPLFLVAEQFGKSAGELITVLMRKGFLYNRNQILSCDEIALLAEEFEIPSRRVEISKDLSIKQREVPIGNGESRRPVVVVMGHVDHGKTTFLDYIRKSNVAAREKGGITQHLGAYEVESSHGKIVFLDTPGHEAFTQMRRYGATVTDLVVLIVAADDGVKPQTLEALECAKSAQVPILVAVNKIDKVSDVTSAMDRIKRQLSEHGLISEDWGGNTVYVPISAKTGMGIDDLVEMIALQADLLELQAFPAMPLQAYILESRLERGFGPVATAIVMRGTLKKGDYIATPTVSCKVRLLEVSGGARVEQVGASVPVRIIGFDRLPAAGEWIESITADQFSRGHRLESHSSRVPQFAGVVDKNDIIINFMVKADTYGSLQALLGALEKIEHKLVDEKITLRVIAQAVGPIVESDVLRAIDSNSLIIGLHTSIDRNAAALAKDHNVRVVQSSIIYHLVEECERIIEQSKKPEITFKKVGEAVVRKVFNIKGQGVIAGSYVTTGTFVRNSKVVCIRNGKELGGGPISSLQKDKKAIKEVAAGFEFAFICNGFQEWAVDDVVHCIIQESSAKKTA